MISTTTIVGVFQKQANAAMPANSPSGGNIIWAVSDGTTYRGTGVAIDTTGAYVVGSEFAGSGPEWRIEKRDLTTGNILFSISEQISSAANGVAVDSTGFYVVGSIGGWDWRIEKRDLTTGASLWTQSEYIGSYEAANGVAVDSTGVYVVGFDSNNVGDFKEWRVEKRALTTGALLWAHSEQISSVVLPEDIASGAAVDGTGLYVVGYDNNAGGSYEWRIEKRSLTDGNILWSVSEYNGGTANAVAVNNMGVYVVGYDAVGLRIEKRGLATGSYIITFGTSGWISEPIGPQGDTSVANGVALDTTGVYVVGADSITPYGGGEWRVEKRDLATGDTLWTQSENIGSAFCEAFGAAVDSTGVYVVGFDSPDSASFEWRVEKRDLGLAPTMTLTTNVVSGSGSVSPNCPSGCSKAVGSSISVSATPSSGWSFSGWIVTGKSCSGGSSSNPCTFAMPNNAVTVSAKFTPTGTTVMMTVSYSVVGGGTPTAPVFNYVLNGKSKSLTLTMTATPVSVDTGSAWKVTPNPLTGSTSAERWHASPSSLSGTASAKTLVFAFQHQYYLTMKVSSSTAGSVTPSSGWHNAGSTVTIKATAKTGHTFNKWTGTGTGSYTGTSGSHTITMNSAITETATFT